MTIREYAKTHNFEVIGTLHYQGKLGDGTRFYVDDGENEYYIKKGESILIIPCDSASCI